MVHKRILTLNTIAVLFMAMSPLDISAQTTLSHTVQRGETIESVAQKYGISVEDIHHANPDTKDFFYAGMKLTIPAKYTPTPSTSITPTPSHSEAVSHEVYSYPLTNRQDIKHQHNRDGFSSLGITFGNDGSELVGWTYGIQGQHFFENGWGATIGVDFNKGLEKCTDTVIKIGPSYYYPITRLLYAMATIDYTLTLANVDDRSGKISGASFVPSVGVALNRCQIGVNANAHWRNGGTLHLGVFLSLNYCF